jgi:hypothetical protein
VTSLGGGNRTFVVDFANLTSCTQRFVLIASMFAAFVLFAALRGLILLGCLRCFSRRLTGNAGGGTVKLRVANCDDAHAGPFASSTRLHEPVLNTVPVVGRHCGHCDQRHGQHHDHRSVFLLRFPGSGLAPLLDARLMEGVGVHEQT